MTNKINSYLATLIIVIAGAGAVWLILHLIDLNSFSTTTVVGSEASYSQLKNSILNQ